LTTPLSGSCINRVPLEDAVEHRDSLPTTGRPSGVDMILSAGLIKDFPRLSDWIVRRLPSVKDNVKVFRAFQQYAELNEKVAQRALQHGNPPEIDRRHIATANGEYLGRKYPGTVFIAISICDRFERWPADARDPRMHQLVESTLLHEMVHWGDWADGKVAEFEAGKAFERAAYGKDVRRHW
jgi:hypothetical protein